MLNIGIILMNIFTLVVFLLVILKILLYNSIGSFLKYIQTKNIYQFSNCTRSQFNFDFIASISTLKLSIALIQLW